MSIKRFRRLKLASIVASLALLASACSGNGDGGGSASEETIDSMSPIELTVTYSSGENSAGGRAVKTAFDEITERTKGKVTFEIFWSGALVPPPEFLSAVGSDVADIGVLSTSNHPQELPISNWILGLGGAPSTAYPHGFLSGVASLNERFTENNEIQQEFANNNVRLMSVYNSGRFDLICSKPVDSVASAKGLTTRAAGAWVGDAKSLGMNTTFVPNTEIYEALQRGLIDCVALPAVVFRDLGLWEVAKNFVPASFSGFPGATHIMNLDKWNALPSEVQTIFDDAMSTTLTTEWIKNDLEGYADFAKRGVGEHKVEFKDPTELDAVLAEHQAEVIDQMVANPPANFSNPEQFIQQYRSDLDKWMTFLTKDAGIPVQPKDPKSIYDSYVKEYDLKSYFEALDKEET
jgi:TRAP-type C4-dicarboxylate transport system substrate-binding protein